MGFGILLGLTTGDGGSMIYSEDLRKVAVELSIEAEAYRNSLVGFGTIDRVELDEVTNGVLASVEKTRSLLDSAPENPQYRGPVSILSATIDQWELGVIAIREAAFAVADDGVDSAAQVRLLNAMIDLKGGDRLYTSFLAALGEADVTQPVSPMPSVAFVPVQIDLPSLSQAMFQTASSSESRLRLRADLALEQILTTPDLVVNTDGAFVVPATAVLTVKAVVRNDGNTRTEPIELSLLLLRGGEIVFEASVMVDAVGAGAQTTVTFEELAVEPGNEYGLVIELPVAEGEEVTDDNRRVLDFKVNEPASSSTTAAP